MFLATFALAAENETDDTCCALLPVKEHMSWITSGAKVIEGRVWQHADVVIEAKHHQWDRENAEVAA
jgi:hypothetical protein